jgi:hypothetical protein
MKSALLVPLASVCVVSYVSSAVAAESSDKTAVAAIESTATGEAPASGGGAGEEPAMDVPEPSVRERAESPRSAENAIYLDLLGPGLFYSINYDRMLTDDLSARIGFSYLSFGASAESSDGSASAEASFGYWAIPLTVSYLGIGSYSNMLEVGGGPVIMHVRGSGIVEADGDSAEAGASTTLFAATAMVGYRHQPADGGFVFRVGASPVMAFGAGLLPWGYLSLGAAF